MLLICKNVHVLKRVLYDSLVLWKVYSLLCVYSNAVVSFPLVELRMYKY